MCGNNIFGLVKVSRKIYVDIVWDIYQNNSLFFSIILTTVRDMISLVAEQYLFFLISFFSNLQRLKSLVKVSLINFIGSS